MIKVGKIGSIGWLILSLTFNNVLTAQNNTDFLEASLLEKSSVFTQHLKRMKPLKVGDRLPIDLSFVVINGSKRHMKFSDFKSKKLIIIDFWATWCSSCVSKFPKLDSIQTAFDNSVQILLVNSVNTGDDEKKVKDFFFRRKKRNGDNYNLLSTICDVDANELFPHKEVPHYVWISSSGIVKAITSSEQVTVRNIQALLTGTEVKMPVKRDFFPDKLLYIGQQDLEVDRSLSYYSAFRKGRLDGATIINQTRLIDSKSGHSILRGKALRNVDLLTIYKAAIELHSKFGREFNNKRLVLDVRDSSSLIFNSVKISKDEWERENLFSYDIIVSESESDSLYEYMVRSVNAHSGYNGRFELKKIRCLELVRTDTIDRLKTKGGNSADHLYNDSKRKYLANLPIGRLVSALDRINAIKLPVIDGTHYAGDIDIELQVDLDNINKIREALLPYGLDIKETESIQAVFIISRSTEQNSFRKTAN